MKYHILISTCNLESDDLNNSIGFSQVKYIKYHVFRISLYQNYFY